MIFISDYVTQNAQIFMKNVRKDAGYFFAEFCLLGYKNPVRTSQETHYFSATESSQLMLSKI
jgi:hypothetical protein